MSSTFRIATSTNLLAFARGGVKRRMLDIIPILHFYGYRNIDLNFCEMMNPDSSVDDAYIQILSDYKASLGLDYVQSHVPYPRDYMALDSEGKRASDDLVERAIRYSVKLGVKAIVIHPVKGSLEENVAYLSRFLPLLEGSGSRLAVENMEMEDEINSASQLLDIVHSLGPKAGVCLDTGHAHLMKHDIAAMIRTLGSELIATHIADNHGQSDEHLLPFFGTIDWESVMKAFGETGYSGTYTYECMFFTRYLPDELKGDAVKLSLRTGQVLSSLLS